MKLTASAVPRLMKCPASAVLPHHEYKTEDADAGVENHEAMEDAANAGETDKLPEAIRDLVAGLNLETETAFAYDVATGESRRLGKVDRAYANLSPYEIPGTLDLLAVGSRLVVVDYKRYLEVDAPDTNAQTTTYALMAARHFRRDDVTVAIAYLGAGRERTEIAELGAFDLDAHAAALRQLHADVLRAASDPQPNPGKWCQFCPAFMSCPKQQDLQLQLTNGITALQIESQLPFQDDETAADAVELLEKVRLVHARLRAAVYARAADKPIPLRGGGYLGTVIKQGNEKLDGDKVYDVLRERHGQAIADAAVVRSATKKRLKEALAFTGGKVAAEERAVLDEVRARGGAKRETKSVVEVYGLALASGDE